MIEKCVRCLLYHLLYGVHQKVTGAMQASPPLRAWALLYAIYAQQRVYLLELYYP